MVLYLRDENNNTLVDISIWGKDSDTVDLRSTVNIKNYSVFLLSHYYRRHEITTIFHELQELRGWLHEKYLSVENKNATKQDVIDRVMKMLKNISSDFKLGIVTD